jgi:cytochrome c biogenesis protein CcdA
MEVEMEQTNQFRANHRSMTLPETVQPNESLASIHACKASQRGLQQANDHLRRANRDLGELAGFIAASLTTVTAVEAVINIAVDKIGLQKDILQVAFDTYIGFLIAILVLGVLRFGIVMRRRAQAEREMDRAKRGIYEFCPVPQWPKAEE